jgi:isoamylase
MILDSLHYWRKKMHVDGFRFDLASIFSSNTDGSISFEEPPIFAMIGSDPDLAKARLIAEPWDAVGTMQLGKKFPGVIWMQWNSLFRDHMRRFVRDDNNLIPEIIKRIYGSEDLFSDDLENAYHAYQSVNYINSHDGFTLYNLVSYNQKHNIFNGHNNMDGTEENYSWNCGKEGTEEVSVEIMQLTKQQAKNFCTLLFTSNGTPMFVAGDEFYERKKVTTIPITRTMK